MVVEFLVEDESGSVIVRGATGDTLLSTLQSAGISIGAVCGGGMMCGTCHVYLSPEIFNALPRPMDEEGELLRASDHYRSDESRLSCQVELDIRMAHQRITVAPDD
jgi:2Fe-2S ferredoxin